MKKVFMTLSLVWMGTIFYFSSQPANISNKQSDFIIKMLSYINENIYEVSRLEFIVRKITHFSVYLMLGIILSIALYAFFNNIYKGCFLAFIVCAIYSVTDEIHQTFVDGRSCELRDVLIDSTGSLIGVCLVFLIMNLKLAIKRKNEKNCTKF